ncbi:MAG: 30S ribosome-binding factor RbfA [Verrucomicrobia bacterium]|nr:30S ribosome-binding factor RbfA [Verrucomicrobiota bacterium]
MNTRRVERVRELLKRELSALLLREFAAADVGLLSVNEVQLTGDLQSATVYVGMVSTPAQKKRALLLLEEHRKRLQSLVGAAVVLKYTPELRFVADESIARGNRVLQILDEIEKTLPPEHP